MFDSSLTAASFLIDPQVSGGLTYDYDLQTVTFNPTQAALDPNTTYTCTLTTDVEDEDGYPLSADYVWSFTTWSGGGGNGGGGGCASSPAPTHGYWGSALFLSAVFALLLVRRRRDLRCLG